MSRTRVLVLFKALGRGGAEQLLVNATPYLNRTEFDYQVAHFLPRYDASARDIERAGLPVHNVEATKRGEWMIQLRALVRALQPDIVHTHSPFTAAGARLVCKRPGGPRLIHTEHNVWESYHPMTRRANMLTFPLNDHVFAVSDHVRRSIRYPAALRFLPMPPVESLYHGLDPATLVEPEEGDGIRESLGIPEDAPVVGTVANFRPEKGHRYLLEAAAHVRRSIPQVRFVLVGHGPLENAIRRQVRQMRLEENVIFTGARDDAQALTASFDVFALGSVYEGLSIALIEALALGTPAVVTKAGGMTEVVTDGVNAIVVPSRNPVALGDGILAVLKDPSLRQRLIRAGKVRAADFDIRVAVGRMEEVYRGLLD